MIQNVLQAACGYHSTLTTYIHRPGLEHYVITGDEQEAQILICFNQPIRISNFLLTTFLAP